MAGSATASAARSDVPVIDIAGYFTDSASARAGVAREIDRACRSIGFLVISGHGVPNELVEATQRVSNAFFDLAAAQKASVTSDGTSARRGYRALEASVLAYSRGDDTAAPDYRELFSIGRDGFDGNDPYYASAEGRRTFTPNVWPNSIPEFEPVTRAYYGAMEHLSFSLMRLFALALGLGETWFDDKVERHISTLQLSNYPEQVTPPRPGQLRASAHSDWGSLTILKAEDKPGGLEVFTAGEWRPVPIIPDTFIVNIGDLMAQWTNDEWVSTLHRVVNPAVAPGVGTRRLSLVYFHQPNYDAAIETIPTCLSQPPKYGRITSGEYLRMRVAQTYKNG